MHAWQEVDEATEARKQQSARLVLAGRSFIEGEDPFEGLTPAQIEEYVQKATGGAKASDPFEVSNSAAHILAQPLLSLIRRLHHISVSYFMFNQRASLADSTAPNLQSPDDVCFFRVVHYVR